MVSHNACLYSSCIQYSMDQSRIVTNPYQQCDQSWIWTIEQWLNFCDINFRRSRYFLTDVNVFSLFVHCECFSTVSIVNVFHCECFFTVHCEYFFTVCSLWIFSTVTIVNAFHCLCTVSIINVFSLLFHCECFSLFVEKMKVSPSYACAQVGI